YLTITTLYRERLARCTAPATLPSHPLLPSLYPPPPVDRRDDILESKQPPRKRLCLSTLGSREVGYDIRDTWINLVEEVPEMEPTTLEKDSHITAGCYGLIASLLTYGGYDDSPGDNIDHGGGGLCCPRGLGSFGRVKPDNRRDDILESKQPPRKRLCLSTLGSREVGYDIRDTWINLVEEVPEMEPTTLEKVNTRVTELVEIHEHDTQDLYALLEDAQDEDPEEYEDDETEDGPVDHPIDGGDDGDDDNSNSSGYDADNEDEDEVEDEDEEHLAPANSAVVIPIDELASLPEGTKPIIPPPSTDTATTRARITVRPQTSISLPPEAEVERLLAMPTPSPS
nr:hypothetical protein [Tanacetum cinerariifolium]